MGETLLDLRDVPAQQRHSKIHDEFDALESGETLQIITDHEPKPLFYEMRAEVESFDPEKYSVEHRSESKFVAALPKK